MDLAQFLFVPAQFVKPGDLISFAALCAFDVILCLCRELLVGWHLSPASRKCIRTKTPLFDWSSFNLYTPPSDLVSTMTTIRSLNPNLNQCHPNELP